MYTYKNHLILFIIMFLLMPFYGVASNNLGIPGEASLIMGKMPADADKFTFAIIADKTGGGQENWPIFDRAVAEINLLNPDFVMTIGDHIQGYVSDTKIVKSMWKEYFDHLSKLEAPVFLVPGNHDISNTVMYNYWRENIGKTYYSFNYNGCHFLVINSEESQSPNGEAAVTEQIVFARILKIIRTPNRYLFSCTNQSGGKRGYGRVSNRHSWEQITEFLPDIHIE